MRCPTPPNTADAREKKCFFTPEEVAHLVPASIPRHIAIIPDGNRRWAKKNSWSIIDGHNRGASNLISTILAAKELGVQTVTFYMFSTENWSRNPVEVEGLMWLLNKFLTDHTPTMIEEGVRFHTIGDLGRLSESARRRVEETKKETAECSAINFVAALNYGGRDDITRAIRKIVDDSKKGALTGAITEELVASYLDTNPWGDPNLLIRTSGETRVSNFLLWQISYSEIYICDILWPDFTHRHLLDAVKYYAKRDRRIGG